MGLPDSDIVTAVYHLLPGFISAWIFYGLTAHPRPSPFERVIQALIFTMFSESLSWILGRFFLLCGRAYSFGVWDQEAAFFWKVLLAVALGFVVAGFANTSRFHSWLPDWLTKRTSYPSEWFSAFNGTKSNIYLQLTGNRRLHGWPEEWPDSPEAGHFVMMNPTWILEDNTAVQVVGIQRMIIPASEVELVEFEEPPEKLQKLTKEIKAASARMLKLKAKAADDRDEVSTDKGED
ncbi:MAG: DUF6338 family protein [Fuerstiella sp.]